MRVNLSGSAFTYTLNGGDDTYVLAADTGYNGFGGTNSLTNVNAVTGTAYNDLLVGNNVGTTTLDGGNGNNTLVQVGDGTVVASFQSSPSAVLINLDSVSHTVTQTFVAGMVTTFLTTT